MDKIHDLIIIGSGPAGLTAAIYTARAGLEPLLFGGLEFGGQLMGTTVIENFPGFPDGIEGPVLMQNMMQQAQKFGTKIEFNDVEKVDFSGEIKKVFANGKEYKAKAIIVATGAKSRRLNIESERKYWGKGVSVCATCDGAFYKDKIVAMVGGGDCAIEEAQFLTRFAKKVYLLNRSDQLRASKIMQENIKKNPKVEILWNTQIKEILGDGTVVTGLKIINNKENSESEIKLDGIFLAIGHIPSTDLFKDKLELDPEGYIVVKDKSKTSVDGVFVAGDVKDKSYRQAITAAGMGCMAALDVEKFLQENSKS